MTTAPTHGSCRRARRALVPTLLVAVSVVVLLSFSLKSTSAAGSYEHARQGLQRLRAGGFGSVSHPGGSHRRVEKENRRVERHLPHQPAIATAGIAAAVAAAASIAATAPAANAKYYPDKCRSLCKSPTDFVTELVPPQPSVGNRATQWMDLAVLQIPTAAKAGHPFSPPMAARYLAVVAMCLHDAMTVAGAPWVPVYNTAQRPSEQTDLNAVISGAASEAMARFFPWDSTKALTAAFLQATGDDKRSPKQFELGKKACAVVIEARNKDGANSLGSDSCVKNAPYCDYTNYAPRNPAPNATAKATCNTITSLNSWQPLCLTPMGADPSKMPCKVQALGGATTVLTKSFSVDPTRLLPANGPPLFGTPREPELIKEIKQLVDISATMGDYEKLVAEFWADGPDEAMPPGHWAHIASTAAVQENLDLQQSVQLFFAVNTAMLDSAVTAWTVKRIYDSARPLQYIQCGLGRTNATIKAWRGPYLGTGDIRTAAWRPYQPLSLLTPPFAGFISGHSTFSRAVAEVMKSFFGSDKFRGPRCFLVPAGKSTLEPKIAPAQPGHVKGRTDVPNKGPGTPGFVPAVDSVMCWETFKEAAEQAGISRLFGGIHIDADNREGLVVGRRVGTSVWAKAMRQWNNKPPLPVGYSPAMEDSAFDSNVVGPPQTTAAGEATVDAF